MLRLVLQNQRKLVMQANFNCWCILQSQIVQKKQVSKRLIGTEEINLGSTLPKSNLDFGLDDTVKGLQAVHLERIWREALWTHLQYRVGCFVITSRANVVLKPESTVGITKSTVHNV